MLYLGLDGVRSKSAGNVADICELGLMDPAGAVHRGRGVHRPRRQGGASRSMLRERSSPYGNALVGVSRGSGNGGASLVRGCWRRVGRSRRCRPVGIRFARPGTSRREEVGRSQGYSTASRHLTAESGIVTVLTAVEGGNVAGVVRTVLRRSASREMSSWLWCAGGTG
jgi:hypothetical protein